MRNVKTSTKTASRKITSGDLKRLNQLATKSGAYVDDIKGIKEAEDRKATDYEVALGEVEHQLTRLENQVSTLPSTFQKVLTATATAKGEGFGEKDASCIVRSAPILETLNIICCRIASAANEIESVRESSVL